MKAKAIVANLLVMLLSLAFISSSTAQESPSVTNTVFILDASGSMRAGLEGSTRLTVAKQALEGLVADLPSGEQVSLWAYGHRLSQDDPSASCQDIEQVIPLSPLEPGVFLSAVNDLNAIGYTPISETLRQVAASLSPDQRNIVVLISDGEETCGGDPCALAAELARSQAELRVNTIGFAVDIATREQLECISQVTGGTYYGADDTASLLESLIEASSMNTGTLQLVDEAHNPLRSLVFSAVDSDGTGQSGLGSLNLSPGKYAIKIETTPPIETSAEVVVDQVTEVVVAADGRIEIVERDNTIAENVFFHVADADSGADVATLQGSGALQPGHYVVTVEAATVFEREIDLEPGQTIRISVEPLALFRFVYENGEIAGDLFAQVYDSNDTYIGGYMEQAELEAGHYAIRFDTIPETTRRVTAVAGTTQDIVIDLPGTLRLVDANGALVDVYVEICRAESGEYLSSGYGENMLQPGVFTIKPDIEGYPGVVIAIASQETLEYRLQFGWLAVENLPEDGEIDLYSLSTTEEDAQRITLYDFLFDEGALPIYTGSYRVEVLDANRTLVHEGKIEIANGQTTTFAIAE